MCPSAPALVRPAKSTKWLGLEQSIAELEALLELPRDGQSRQAASFPFDGIFGFSQGALVAALLVAKYPTLFKFAVLVCRYN